MALKEKIRKIAKDNDISISQAEQLWEFPFKYMKSKMDEIDLLKKDPEINFLWKDFITIKMNKYKLNNYKKRLKNKDVF
jgi:hypothetical protein